MKILWGIWIFSPKAYGSNLTCCFETHLANHSVSYHLSRPRGSGCTRIWSEKEINIVDENDDVDEKKVVFLGPEKLILRNPNEEIGNLTYREDCLNTGKGYTAKCNDPCPAFVVSSTAPADRDQSIKYDIGLIIILIVVIITTPIIVIICYRKRKCPALNLPFRCSWRAVALNETVLGINP